MKSFAVAAFVALASVAAAQDLIAIVGRLPACSQSCLVDPLGKDGCGPTDFKCHCGKADQLFNDVIPCVQQSCSADDQKKAVDLVQDLCKQAGVPVVVPTNLIGAPTPTPTGPGGPGNTQSSTSQSTGGAAQATQAAGILGAAALAFLAL